MAKKLSPKEELAKQTKIWYDKLKADGFNDIETAKGNLKEPAMSIFTRKKKNLSPAQIEAKQIYYRMANHFLVDYEFANILEKVIWEYHANGMGVRHIAEELHRVKIDRTRRDTVHRIIRRLQKEMFKLYRTEDKTSDDEAV